MSNEMWTLATGYKTPEECNAALLQRAEEIRALKAELARLAPSGKVAEDQRAVTRELERAGNAVVPPSKAVLSLSRIARQAQGYEAAVAEREEAVRWIRVVSEELVRAGGAGGDRTVALANLRALVKERDAAAAESRAMREVRHRADDRLAIESMVVGLESAAKRGEASPVWIARRVARWVATGERGGIPTPTGTVRERVETVQRGLAMACGEQTRKAAWEALAWLAPRAASAEEAEEELKQVKEALAAKEGEAERAVRRALCDMMDRVGFDSAAIFRDATVNNAALADALFSSIREEESRCIRGAEERARAEAQSEMEVLMNTLRAAADAPKATVFQLKSGTEWLKAMGFSTPEAAVAGVERLRAEVKACAGFARLEDLERGLRQVLEVSCAVCGNPATCIGAYESMGHEAPACDDCCGHGNEDGRCEPALPLLVKRLKAERDVALSRPSPQAQRPIRRWLELQFGAWLERYPASGDRAEVLHAETREGKAAVTAGEVRAFLALPAEAGELAPAPSGPFRGRCMGVRLQAREPGRDPHVMVALEVEDDGKWHMKPPFSSAWLEELLAQLQRARAFCLTQEADMHEGRQYGWKFKGDVEP